MLAEASLAAQATSHDHQQQPRSEQSEPADPTSALEFLGSYSAPGAVLSTDTSHTSARPPAPPTEQRLRSIQRAQAALPPWPLDLIWDVELAAAACSDIAAGSKAASGKAGSSRAVLRDDLSRANQALGTERFQEARALYDRLLPRYPCRTLRWNRAVAQAYTRWSTSSERFAALATTGNAAELSGSLADAPSPETGHMILGLEQLAAGNVDAARAALVPLLEPKVPSSDAGRVESPSAAETSSAHPPQREGVATAAVPGTGGEHASAIRERDLLWTRAMLAWASDDPARAREYLSHLSGLEPNSPAVWFELGGAALADARDYSRRLAQSAPESVWNRRLEGEALEVRYPSLAQRVRESGGAEPETTDGPGSSDSSSPAALYEKAREALQLSEAAYRRASQSPLFAAQMHALKALAAEQENDQGTAIGEYRTGLAADPESAILHAGLGHLYREGMKLEDAQQELAKAWSLNPTDPVVAFELGDVFLRLRQPDRALPLLNRAIELDPALLIARWSRAKTYLVLGDDSYALADLEAAAPVDDTGELQWQLARLYEKLGRADLAAEAERRSEEQRQAHALHQ